MVATILSGAPGYRSRDEFGRPTRQLSETDSKHLSWPSISTRNHSDQKSASKSWSECVRSRTPGFAPILHRLVGESNAGPIILPEEQSTDVGAGDTRAYSGGRGHRAFHADSGSLFRKCMRRERSDWSCKKPARLAVRMSSTANWWELSVDLPPVKTS